MGDDVKSKTGTGSGKRGFGSMSQEKRKEIAAKGGRAVDPANRSFTRDRELARSAGSKGGSAIKPEQRAYSLDPVLASKAGKISRPGTKKPAAPKAKP